MGKLEICAELRTALEKIIRGNFSKDLELVFWMETGKWEVLGKGDKGIAAQGDSCSWRGSELQWVVPCWAWAADPRDNYDEQGKLKRLDREHREKVLDEVAAQVEYLFGTQLCTWRAGRIEEIYEEEGAFEEVIRDLNRDLEFDASLGDFYEDLVRSAIDGTWSYAQYLEEEAEGDKHTREEARCAIEEAREEQERYE